MSGRFSQRRSWREPIAVTHWSMHREQRRVRVARQAAIELEIAARGGVDDQRIGALFDGQRADVRHGGLLRVAHILQQRAGGADGERQLIRAEALQIERAELIREQARRARQLEVPGRARAQRGAGARDVVRLARSRRRAARRASGARARAPSACAALRLQHREAAGGEIEPREAEALAVARHRGEQRVAPLVEQRLVRDRAGRDDAHDLRAPPDPSTSPGRPAARRPPRDSPLRTSFAR